MRQTACPLQFVCIAVNSHAFIHGEPPKRGMGGCIGKVYHVWNGVKMMEWKRDIRTSGEVIKIEGFFPGTGERGEYLTFPSLERTGIVRHLITTRFGGVSEGEFSTMNFSFSRGDSEEHVRENYQRISRVLGCNTEDMVASQQTHTTNIRQVTENDRGKGVTRPLDYQNVDGLMTNESGLALVTFFADCVPLLFVDPVHHAIGSAHSGWRGTAAKMGQHMVTALGDTFGTRPEDLQAAIGPSICQACYEVSEDVAEQFVDLDKEAELLKQEILVKRIYRSGLEGGIPRVVCPGASKGKYQLDLWLANLLILLQAGIPLQQIAVTDICTMHNSRRLFSHRASGGRRGNMAAFLMLI